MKTIIILFMIFGFYACDESTVTQPKEDFEIMEMMFINDNGFSKNSPDTLLVTKDNIILKYGKMSSNNNWGFKELKDTTFLNISNIFELVNSISVNEFKSNYESNQDIPDSHRYKYIFKSDNKIKFINFTSSSVIPTNLKKLNTELNTIVKDYKLKNPLE